MSILNWFKSALSIYKAKQKLYSENYFSEEFLMDALLGAGFQSVEILAPTEEGAIDLGAKLFDERGNSFIISVHHLGNELKFSARSNTQAPKNVNYLFVKDVYTKILRGQFPSGTISFQPEITKIQKFKLKKLKPEIDERFLEGISGKDLNVVI